MTFDLEAARALHDRSPYGPYCTTCLDGQSNPLDWPCDTAIALGATGRSEWLDAPAAGPSVTYNIQASGVNVTRLNTDGTPFELPSLDFSEETKALVDHRTRTTEPEVCGSQRRDGVERCTWILRDGSRCDASGPDEPHHATQCDRTSVSGRRCQLGLGHVDTFHDMDPEQCGHVSGEDSCTEVKGHIVNAALPHRSGPRTWWPSQGCGGVGENTYQNCCLAEGHKLRCHFEYLDGSTLVRCADISRSQTPCALPVGHSGSHADLDGLRWGGLPLVEQMPDPEPGLCGMGSRFDEMVCVLETGHDCNHKDRDGDTWGAEDEDLPPATPEPELCGSHNPVADQDGTCTLELGHTQLHDDRSGMRWSDDAEPPSLRNRCQEVTPSEVAPAGRRCARRWGHGNEHVTSNGEPWTTAEPQPEEATCTGRLSTHDGEIRCQLAAGHVGVHTRGDCTWNWRGEAVDMCPEAGCAYVAGHVVGHRGWDGRQLS